MTDKPTRMSREELAGEAGAALPPKEVLSLLDLNVDADVALDLAAPIDLAVAANANVAAPIDGAVAANANVAAPINASVAANIGSDGAVAQSLADQQVDIHQDLDDVSADATAEQNADIQQ